MSILNELSLFAKNYSILIVEDQKELNDELVEICQLFFRQVDSALNGKEALVKFKNNPEHYDIVLSDITMPEMNGVSLSREIKSLNRTQNIIILSAHNEIQYLIELIDIGISQFIAKPFEEQELLFRLLKVCENIFYKKEYIKMVMNDKTQELDSQVVLKELEKITSSKKLVNLENQSEKIEVKTKNSEIKTQINDAIPHNRVSASKFLSSMQKDDYVWSVMESQIEELLILIDELHEEIEKIYLNNISASLILYVASILRKIYSIFSFLDELSKLAKVLFKLVIFLESLDVESLSNEKRNKLKILEFIYDDVSRFVETVFIYKDTLDISYLEDSLNSSVEQLKMSFNDEKIEEEELELF